MQDYTTMIATTQYNANNAVYFNGNTGNLNTNNKYNQLSVRPVLAFSDSYIAITRSASFFSLLLDMYAAYYHCRKFFMQHWTKGVHYLGFYIRRGQLYMDNRVVHNCKERLRHYIELAEYDPDYIFDKRDEFVSVVNSYFGLFLHAHSYNLRKSLCNTIISSPWGKVVEFKGYAKCCVKAQFKKRNIIRNNVRKQISLTSRIINKYQILSLCTQKSKTAA